MKLVHNSERQDEICQDIRDLRMCVDTLLQRMVDLEAMVREHIDSHESGGLGAHFDARIEQSVNDTPNGTSRSIANALGAAMLGFNRGKGMDGRTLVNHMSRALHEWDPDGEIYGKRNGSSEIPFGFARYVAESVPGSNSYGAHTTRRVHKMLSMLKVAA